MFKKLFAFTLAMLLVLSCVNTVSFAVKPTWLERFERSIDYAETPEAQAVCFVKKYMSEESIGKWVNIIDCEQFEGYGKLNFRYVTFELYDRKIKPRYIKKEEFKSKYLPTLSEKYEDEDEEELYIRFNRQITWETSHRDIVKQISEGVVGDEYRIMGEIYFLKGKPYYRIIAIDDDEGTATEDDYSTNGR